MLLGKDQSRVNAAVVESMVAVKLENRASMEKSLVLSMGWMIGSTRSVPARS